MDTVRVGLRNRFLRRMRLPRVGGKVRSGGIAACIALVLFSVSFATLADDSSEKSKDPPSTPLTPVYVQANVLGGGSGGGGMVTSLRGMVVQGYIPPEPDLSPSDLLAKNKGDLLSTPRDQSEKLTCDRSGVDAKTLGDPVVFSTGNEVMPETDFVSAGEMGLSLTRTYNHYWSGVGIFGRRWLSNYDYKLLFTTHDPTSPCYTRPGNTSCDPTNKPIWALRPDGRLIRFNYSATPTPGWYEDKPAPIAKIVKNGSKYTLYSEDHTVEVYDDHGFPLSMANQHGVGWTFTYGNGGYHYLTRVTNSSGRHVDFGWSNGLLTQVTDPAGHVYHYSYKTIPVTADAASASVQTMSAVTAPPVSFNDPPPVRIVPDEPLPPSMVALLTSATGPTMQNGKATVATYHYGDTRFVTALTGKSINGSRWSWITYDANARVVQTKLAGDVEIYKFSYELNDKGRVSKATITNPLNRKTVYTFDENGNRTSMSGIGSTSCPTREKALEYDDNGYLSGVTDFNGYVTLFTYAANGELKKRVRGEGPADEQVIKYEWDTIYHRPTKITMVGDHETSYGYNTNNRLISVSVKNISSSVSNVKGQTHAVTYTYTTWPNHLVKSLVVNGPLHGNGDVITYTYSQTGDLLSRKDTLGHTVTYGGYNGLGEPGYIIGPNGDRRDYVYDARGRVVDVQTHRHGGTQHTYYKYDSYGKLASVTSPDGHAHYYQYDVAGRMTAEFEPRGDGTYDETAYAYNAMSLPVSIKKQQVFEHLQQGTMP